MSVKCQYAPIKLHFIVPASAVDNPVDMENDIRHDVPSLLEANRHELTCTYYYRTDSLRPEKGLVKGGPGPSCTRPHTEKDHKQADSQDTSFSSGGGNVRQLG